jgi:FKBP-type peptidyl-prolyl cis-trans isomerase FklB
MRVLLALLLGFALIAGYGCAAEKTVLKDDKDRLSYSFGVNIGKSLKNQSVEIDPDILSQGFKDAYTDSELLMAEQAVLDMLASYDQEMREKHAERTGEVAEKNKTEGEAFLAANKEKEGVVVLQSGLQYRVITKGTGRTPEFSDMVKTHYRGTLIDGTEFDSSYERGEAVVFPVNGVIKGWTEALMLMKEGAKWEIFIPADLAYGVRGAGSMIEPNATLIFELELISIESTQTPHG